MIDFERFWMEGDSPYETNAEIPPGVTSEEIPSWERKYGVTLPEPIRTALGLRNGGNVRNTTVAISPLDEIVPADDAFWEWTEINEDQAPDHGLMFVFGDETETGATYLMNFNARGPEGSPSVYIDHHGESTYLVNDTIAGFFESELASTAEPGVDWSEAESSLCIIARETIDLTDMDRSMSCSHDQILASEGDTLILFTRERTPERQTLTRTTLPRPLDADCADIRPLRPAPNATFTLHLQPVESEGIVHEESETNDDGRWKNSTNHGVPIYVMFESPDQDRLQALRTQVFGSEGASQARAKQDRQAAMEAELGKLPPQQRSAAFLNAALKIRGDNQSLLAESFGGADKIPPELAQASELMRLRMEQMAEKIRQQAAANPPDPETIRRVEGYLRDLGA